MARTTKSDVLIAEILNQAISGALAQKDLLFNASKLAGMGIVAVSDTFNGDASMIGNEVTVPYFGTIGAFTRNMTDGDAVDTLKIAQTSEKATVQRSSLAIEATRWASSSMGGDAYAEAGAQVVKQLAKEMEGLVMEAAVATTSYSSPLKLSKFDATTPRYFDYDLMIEGKLVWGDEQDDIAALAVHSATLGDLYRLKDGNGRPILVDPLDGSLPKLLGVPVYPSDMCPVTGSTMSAVTESGTTPPDIAITTNTPNGPWKLKIVPVTAGARGTATIKFSLDGGMTYSAPITTAASIPLVDPAVDSTIGVNGQSGLTISYENASSNADNVWTATATVKATSLLLKKSALGFWFNKAALQLKEDVDILRDSRLAALHLYAAPIRYRRRPGGTKSGVVLIEHNARVVF